jgi:membrane-associated phospholipid phosphatase
MAGVDSVWAGGRRMGSGGRLFVALALVVLLGITSGLPVVARIDQLITASIQQAIPDISSAAASLVFLANAATMIPALAAIGVVFLFFNDTRRATALLLSTFGALGASASAAIFEHVIVHPGPPEALKMHLRRPADALVAPYVPDRYAVAAVGVLIAAGLVRALFPSRRQRAVSRPASLWPMAVASGVCIGVLLLGNAIRPLLLALNAIVKEYAAYGYPSGHMTRTVLLAGTVLRRASVLGVAVVIAMALSLVYLGDHWTSEVLGGVCLGWAGVEVGREVWRRLTL